MAEQPDVEVQRFICLRTANIIQINSPYYSMFFPEALGDEHGLNGVAEYLAETNGGLCLEPEQG
jgi:hypothetical protein